MVDDAAAGAAGSADDAGTAVAGVADEATAGVAGFADDAGAGVRTPAQAGLTSAEAERIQNAANRINKPIYLVGSRANGTAGHTSDWDYVIEGLTSANKNAIKNSLPGSPVRADQIPRMIDFLPPPLKPNLPYVPFLPKL